jgi:OmpA-OmpF porin, OOP family
MGERRMVIEGHTDNVGSDSYNDDLSTRRANAVGKALVSKYGVAREWLTTRGLGERKPVKATTPSPAAHEIGA